VRFAWLLLLLTAFYGCAQFEKTEKVPSKVSIIKESKNNKEHSGSVINLRKLFSKNSLDFFKKRKIKERSEVELVENDEVKKWINYFSNENRKTFERYLLRGTSYREMIELALVKEKIPKELYYLAMIESGFVLNATSDAKAVGIWQLIDSTARRYGLRVDDKVDERYDPYKSTKAAVQYLKDLHNVYQSWPLAIAAYNSGERRVLNAIMSNNGRDFWEISKKKLLPQETIDYVPKFMAARIIGEDLERFAIDQNLLFKNSRKLAMVDYMKFVRKKVTPIRSNLVHMITRGESLFDISRTYKISISRLKELNGIKGSEIYVGQIIKLR